MLRFVITTVCLLVSLPLAGEENSVTVEIVPLTDGIYPGQAFDVAVVFSMHDGWHTYWENPGDAGMATEFLWTYPDDFTMHGFRQSVPKRHVDAGITTFIHENEAIYFFQFLPPDSVLERNVFRLEVNWLECKDICLPGSDALQFELPGKEGVLASRKKWLDLIRRAEKHFPIENQDVLAETRVRGDALELRFIRWPEDPFKMTAVDFFPSDEMSYDLSLPVEMITRSRKHIVKIPLLDQRQEDPKYLKGVLIRTLSSPDGVVVLKHKINKPINP